MPNVNVTNNNCTLIGNLNNTILSNKNALFDGLDYQIPVRLDYQIPVTQLKGPKADGDTKKTPHFIHSFQLFTRFL